MKKISSVLILGLLAFGLVGCKEKPSGEVSKKEIRPPYTIVQMMPMIVTSGDTTTTILVPFLYMYPERYVVTVKWFDSKADKWKYYDYFVKKSLYDEVNIGDQFGDQDGVYSEEPYEREKQQN